MGEAKRRQLAVQKQAQEGMAVDTPGGRIHVQWDQAASATPNAQLTFFAEFLAATGVYDTWVNTCPLNYTSPNAPGKKDVLGTWLLSMLAGHRRYAHITALRGDAVARARENYRNNPDPSFLTHGPRTRREFLNFKAWGG